jgi:hypothetical protein
MTSPVMGDRDVQAEFGKSFDQEQLGQWFALLTHEPMQNSEAPCLIVALFAGLPHHQPRSDARRLII